MVTRGRVSMYRVTSSSKNAIRLGLMRMGLGKSGMFFIHPYRVMYDSRGAWRTVSDR